MAGTEAGQSIAGQIGTDQITDRENLQKVYDVLNGGKYTGSDLQKSNLRANEIAQNQFAGNLQKTQTTALDAIRRSNASAIASGANAGLGAANQLSSILGLQQESSMGATQLANDFMTKESAEAKKLAELQIGAVERGALLTNAEANQTAANADLWDQLGQDSEALMQKLQKGESALSVEMAGGQPGLNLAYARQLYELGQGAATLQEKQKFNTLANAILANPTAEVLEQAKQFVGEGAIQSQQQLIKQAEQSAKNAAIEGFRNDKLFADSITTNFMNNIDMSLLDFVGEEHDISANQAAEKIRQWAVEFQKDGDSPEEVERRIQARLNTFIAGQKVAAATTQKQKDDAADNLKKVERENAINDAKPLFKDSSAATEAFNKALAEGKSVDEAKSTANKILNDEKTAAAKAASDKIKAETSTALNNYKAGFNTWQTGDKKTFITGVWIPPYMRGKTYNMVNKGVALTENIGTTSDGNPKDFDLDNAQALVDAVNKEVQAGNVSGEDAQRFLNSFQIKNDSCITGSTLITMADGKQKQIKNIKAGEAVMSYNPAAGNIVTTLYTPLEHAVTQEKILRLMFSNGNYVDVVNGHSFCLAHPRKCVDITEENYTKYIDKEFMIGPNQFASLKQVDMSLTKDPVYSPMAHKYIWLYTNGILSAAHYTEFIVNARLTAPNVKKKVTYEQLPKSLKTEVTEEIYEAYDGEMIATWAKGFRKFTLRKKIKNLITTFLKKNKR